ncbi:hypothetical protein HO173_002900 [Letharia columbiana]|uniref:Uncharacterized protein n=1 Tax=Letharia columbiana TaxID=112416 RepID=A0A8H6L829_9LECA|nr:uncharacterized protein HO173_002900 [Letharia columbiana]KAF6239028.1 hypothetical protein HO173_002900 [Letharia columbiana]
MDRYACSEILGYREACYKKDPKHVRVLASNLTQNPSPARADGGGKRVVSEARSTIRRDRKSSSAPSAQCPRARHVSISRSDQIGQPQARFVGSRRGPDADDVEALSDAERMYGWAAQNCRRAIADTEVLLQETEGNASFCRTTRAKLRYPQR